MAHDENEDLKNIMGARLKTAQQVPVAPGTPTSPTSAYQPPKSEMPERPGAPATPAQPATPNRGTPSPFPVINPKDAPVFKEDPLVPFAGDRAGKFDPELNEFALSEVAADRGVTVDELLKTDGKKLERKVEPLNPNEQAMSAADAKKMLEAQAAKAPTSFAPPEAEAPPTNQQALELELEALELQKKELEIRRRLAEAPRPEAPTFPPPAPKNTKPVLHPVLQRMREKLSLDNLAPAKIEIEGLLFELLPPPPGAYPWILEKFAELKQVDKRSAQLTLQKCTASLGLVRVEGAPIAEVLGLVPEGAVTLPLRPNVELRVLTAQALFEMIEGEPSLEQLFPFNPSIAGKLAQVFDQAFKNLDLKSSLDPLLRHFICPVPECVEVGDYAVAPGTPVFCQVHGVPMEDKGLSVEVKSLPLP